MDRVGVIVIEDKEDIVVRDHETTDLVLWCGGRSLEGIRRRSGVNRDNEYSFENNFEPRFESTRNQSFQRNQDESQQGGRRRRGSFRRRESCKEEDIDYVTKEIAKVTFTYETYEERK